MIDVADERILAGSPATLHASIFDQDGAVDTGADACTVTVTRADGTVLVNAQSAGGADGLFTYALTAAQTATLDRLTATWTVSSVVRAATLHEVVGGYYFTVAEALAAEPSIAGNDARAAIIAARRDVEDEFETICACAFVPRYAHVRVEGCGDELVLPHPSVRSVRSVRLWYSSSSYTDLTGPQCAAIICQPGGVIERIDGGVFGGESIEIGYEHGLNRPPADLKRAAIRRLRQRLNMARSGIPDRAVSFALSEGGTYKLDTAGATKTGDPEIDGVLDRYSMRVPGVA